MRRSTILIGGLVFAAIVITSLFAYRNQTSGSETRVIMKENRFDPETVTIRKGGRATFKNEDSRQWWPASNLHPTHEIYPEFDPLKPIDPGHAWTFTFTKPGRWRYHDHLAPTILGTVEVIQQ